MVSGVVPHRGRVLLVDDEESTRAALERWLSYDYEVITAVDGIDGLEAALRCSPDVIVADVWMPRCDGIEMVRRIKQVESLRRVPVLFLSGQTSVPTIVAGIDAGARAYIKKPVDLDVLDRKIRRALGRRYEAMGAP